MRIRSNSQNSSSGSHTSSHSNNSLQQHRRRQIDEAEEAEELDYSSQHFSVQHQALRSSNPSIMAMNNNPGLPPQPSHLASPFIASRHQHYDAQQRRQEMEPNWDREAGVNGNALETAAFHNHHKQPTPWILTLYCPTSMASSWGDDVSCDKFHKKHGDNSDPVEQAAIIRVHVTADMTPESWRQCIQHATSQYSVAPIAGLFRKLDFGYFSLEYIWEISSATTDNEYWLYLPPNYRDRRHKRGPPHRSWWWQRLIGWTGSVPVMLVLLAVYLLLRLLFSRTAGSSHKAMGFIISPFEFQQYVVNGIYDYSTWMHRVCIYHPIQDFYRHGPTWLGAWEGMPLSQICVRLSLMGDEDFWKRNMDDCQRMYQLKQDAVVRTIQPLVYAGILYMMWCMMKLEYLRRRQYQPDPNMVELYHAFHVVLRQVQRVLAASPPAAGRN